MTTGELRFVDWTEEIYVALFQVPTGEPGQYEEKIYSGIYWDSEYQCPKCKRGTGHNYATVEVAAKDLGRMFQLVNQIERELGYSWRLIKCSREGGWEVVDKDELMRNTHTQSCNHGENLNREVKL